MMQQASLQRQSAIDKAKTWGSGWATPSKLQQGELRKCPLQLELSILLATCPDADIELPTLSHRGLFFESKFQIFPLSSLARPKLSRISTNTVPTRALPKPP